MIVLDTSAVMAVLLREPDARTFAGAIEGSSQTLMSSGTLLELNIVADKLRATPGHIQAQRFVTESAIEIVPFDAKQAGIAAEAYRRFGRGNHPAGLNFGDCFAYALAKSLDAPLLFKGADFSLTDVRPWRA